MDLAEYMAMGLAVELYKCKSNDLPYINVDTGDAQLNPLMQEIHEYTDHAASYTIWWDNLLEGTDAARYLDSLECLFSHEDITPEEFASRMNRLNAQMKQMTGETGWK